MWGFGHVHLARRRELPTADRPATMEGCSDAEIRDVLLGFLRDADFSPVDSPPRDHESYNMDEALSWEGLDAPSSNAGARSSQMVVLPLPEDDGQSAPAAVAAGRPFARSSTSGKAAGGSNTNGSKAAGKAPKRRQTSQQKVAELEKRVAQATAQLQQLSISNTFMSERVRTLEIVRVAQVSVLLWGGCRRSQARRHHA